MAQSTRETYQIRHGVHLAIADLVRAGMKADAAEVESIARKLIQAPPTGVREPEQFVATVTQSLTSSTTTARRLTRSFGVNGAGPDVTASGTPDPSALDLTFNTSLQAQLNMLIKEQVARAALFEAGLYPVSKVLLSGPPGVGKTMSAHWLAGQLKLPLVVLDLSQTISSFLGESGKNVRRAFADAEAVECVFLIDEFDALAKRRDDASDIGELKRLVNVLLLELDRWSGRNLLIAATNHAQLLDPAVQRRFDLALTVPLPTEEEVRAILSGVLARQAVDSRLIALAANTLVGSSNSDVVRYAQGVYRDAVVYGEPIDRKLLESILDRTFEDRALREEVWMRLKDDLGMSSRTIATHVKLSHPTVNDGIKRARERVTVG